MSTDFEKDSGRDTRQDASLLLPPEVIIARQQALGKKKLWRCAMTKNDLINDVVYEMAPELTREQADRLKITMMVKMQDYEITQMASLPMVWTYDNEWLLKRFLIDSMAKGLKHSTALNYVQAVRRLLDETGKNYRQLTGQDITDYLALKQYRDKISINYKATLSRYYTSFFRWAYKKHHIEEDITRDVDSVRSIKKKKERLTDEEIEDIREACQTLKERAVFELMMSTGMRVGEIAALNISDLDLQQKRVNIYGEKTSQYRTGMLSTKAVKALKAYLDSRGDNMEPLFIVDRKPYSRISNTAIERIAKEIAERAGIKRIRATVHVYRKTFASIMYRKTKNILFVSKLLGHASTEITVNYYLVDDLDDMQYMYNMANG